MNVLIAIQNYNGDPWLAECISSVVAVRRCALVVGDTVDICLLDAGSTDRSLEIASYFPDVELLKHDRLSQAQAMNLAIKTHNFDWFGFVNNDDHLFPQYWQEHKKTIQKIPESDIVHGYGIFWMENNKTLHMPDPNAWMEKMQIGHNHITQPTVCISKKCFDKYGIFDETYKYCYDWEYVTRIWNFGGIINVTQEALCFYRSRAGNMSHMVVPEIIPEWKRVGRTNCGVDDPR